MKFTEKEKKLTERNKIKENLAILTFTTAWNTMIKTL